MATSFDGLTLAQPKFEIQPTPLVSADRLVSGETKVTTSTKVSHIYTVSCIATGRAGCDAIIAKFGVSGTLILDGTSYTKCSIKSYSENELNPTYIEVKLGFVRDTTT